MSRINFVRFDNNGDSVEVKTSGDKGWPELTEDFIYFLRGCGYQVNFEDIRDYLVELCGDDRAVPVSDWDADQIEWPRFGEAQPPSTDEVTCSVTAPTIPESYSYKMGNYSINITEPK